jgi:membrane associated rhomboid family serine protease
MGLYDRDYTQYDGGYHERPQMRLAMPSLTPGVKWLLIINVAIFVVSVAIRPLGILIGNLFAVNTLSWHTMIQVWRLVSYQFLHDLGGFGHIFFNMLLLYMMGTILERHWGTRRFVYFYLGCGVVGGLFYYILAGWLGRGIMVGASGSILVILTACAILFPQIRLYIWGIFPIAIRVLALILMGISVLTIMQGSRGVNAGGEAAHLGGMLAGALYVFARKYRIGFASNIQRVRTERRQLSQDQLQTRIDQILDKVHQQGIHSLTRQERNTLKQATEAEQQRRRPY